MVYYYSHEEVHVFRMCIIFQDVVPETFNLIEVLLDKGVNEQVLPSDARPWQILQKSRKVTHPILHSSLCLDNVTREILHIGTWKSWKD